MSNSFIRRIDSQMDLMPAELSQYMQRIALMQMKKLVDTLKNEYKAQVECAAGNTPIINKILNNFGDKLTKYIDAISKEMENENPKASWEEGLDAMKQFDHEMTVVLFVCSSSSRCFTDAVKKKESEIKKLKERMDVVRKIDELNKIEVKTGRFKRNLTEFKRILNKEEIGETIYSLKNTKAFWQNRMDDIRHQQQKHELSMAFLVGSDMEKELENIENVYDSKLRELNTKINVLKETEKVRKAESIANLQKKIEQIETKMLQMPRIAKEEEGASVEETKASENEDKNQQKAINVELAEVLENIETSILKHIQQIEIKSDKGLQKILEQIETKMLLMPRIAKDEDGAGVKVIEVSGNEDKIPQKPVNVELDQIMENIETSTLKQTQQIQIISSEIASMEGAKNSENKEKNQQKPANTERSEVLGSEVPYHMSYAIIDRFKKKILKFRKSLNEDEIGETTYLLEHAMASWEKQINEIKELEHQFTRVYLLDTDIDKDFKVAEKLHKSKLKELNRKINVLKEADTTEKDQAIANLQTIFEPTQTQVQPQIAKAEEGDKEEKTAETEKSTEVMNCQSNVILDLFRKKIAKFRKSLNEEEIGDPICFLEATKASWEKQMDTIKHVEHELATVYFRGNDIEEDFEDIEKINESKLKELNGKINALIEADKVEKNVGIRKLQKILG